ncbi:sulfotransferase family protein [Oceanomicrobium pacificus]|uniref:Sulfotransferase n=1 Tax=Oceanomicrobium pacificus TaxID=2692916 RepID=A0A6B0TL42_9RHOB|nr:sulfotransferase [Oceanomicrobium pacificus]MXU65217.1 hypothetical protein [Oceanomicrobium pacificus]
MASKFDLVRPASLPEQLRIKGLQTLNLINDFGFQPLDFSDLKPVFVVGCGHSGTSLLATILGRCPDLMHIGYESGLFFPSKNLRTAKEVTRAWANLARQGGFSGFVEKTPKHVHAIDRILRVVPNARFVAITRDGRDVLASFLKRGVDRDFAIKRWVTDNEAMVSRPDAQFSAIVRYESLVSDTEHVVRQVCEAIEVPYADSMLHSDGSGYNWIKDGNMAIRAEQTRQPVYNNQGGWTSKLTQEDITAFNRIASATMRKLEYDI